MKRREILHLGSSNLDPHAISQTHAGLDAPCRNLDADPRLPLPSAQIVRAKALAISPHAEAVALQAGQRDIKAIAA